MRGSVEPAALSRGRATVVCPHHGHLGTAGDGHDVRKDTARVLCHALPAGYGRGGLFPGRDLLSLTMVPGTHAGACHQPLLRLAPAGLSAHGGHRWTPP